MKNLLIISALLILFASCEKDNGPVTIESYLSGKVVFKLLTNPSGSKVFFVSGVIDRSVPSYTCFVPYTYQLSCTDGEHALYFEKLPHLMDIAADENCNLYACINTKLVKFTPPNDSITIKTTNSFFSSVVADSSGKLWVGTYNDGLYYYDTKVWKHYTKKNSELTGNYVAKVEIARNSDIWLSVQGDTSSLTCISDGNFKTYEWKDLIGKNVDYLNHFAVDKDGNAWAIFSDEGHKLVKITKNGTLTYQTPAFILDRYISQLGSDYTGRIYIVVYDITSKIYIYNGSLWDELITGINDKFINDIAVDSEQNLWLGTQDGIKKTSIILKN